MMMSLVSPFADLMRDTRVLYFVANEERESPLLAVWLTSCSPSFKEKGSGFFSASAVGFEAVSAAGAPTAAGVGSIGAGALLPQPESESDNTKVPVRAMGEQIPLRIGFGSITN